MRYAVPTPYSAGQGPAGACHSSACRDAVPFLPAFIPTVGSDSHINRAWLRNPIIRSCLVGNKPYESAERIPLGPPGSLFVGRMWIANARTEPSIFTRPISHLTSCEDSMRLTYKSNRFSSFSLAYSAWSITRAWGVCFLAFFSI